MGRTIIRAKGGQGEHKVDVDTLLVPDLWHIAMALQEGKGGKLTPVTGAIVLDCWALCHDLLKHIRES